MAELSNHHSLSQRLHESLHKVITTTETGARLPSEPNLARRLGVSRATLREAMRTFETQGLIQRRQGVGTFVVRPAHVIESGLEVLESVESLAKRIGLQVAMGDLKFEHRPATKDEADILQLSANASVICLSRVIRAEDRPVAYFVDTVPDNVLSEEAVRAGFRGSVLELFLELGEPRLVNSRCEISAVAADRDIARALNIQRGDALLRFISHLYAVDGRVVDYSLSYFLPGYFSFHVVRELDLSNK